MAPHTAGKYIVGKALERQGMRLEPGTVVDVTGWRNVDKLVALRYLRPAPKGAEAALARVDAASADAIDPEPAPVKKTAAKKTAAKKAASKKAE